MSQADQDTTIDWSAVLPEYGDLFPSQGPSLVKSFSLFSLFRSKTPAPSIPSAPSLSTIAPLFDLPSVEPVSTPRRTFKALASFQTYLTGLRSHLESRGDEEDNDANELLVGALKGYGQAVYASRAGWADGDIEDVQRLRHSLPISLQGLVGLYRTLAADPDASQACEKQLDDTRMMLLASIFANSTDLPHNHIVPIFNRARKMLTSLQATLRPIAHSKAVAQVSPVPVVTVSDTDATEIMSILQLYADEVEKVEVLSGPVKSKTKAQKEQDKRRPLRISLEAHALRCDVALSMANRDIKAIKARARKALPAGEDEDPRPDADDDEEGVKWEQLAEQALIDLLGTSRSLMEDKRGGVLSDKVDRSDWLGEEEDLASPKSPARSAKSDGSMTEEIDTVEEWDSEEEEDDESEDEELIDTYPCPLRSVFRLHDRYEEQRLAVWLSLPTATRPGMGTYMRGEDGKVGEVWDGLGLLLLLDYDSDALGNFGLSADKLDKWVELAAKRNSKKIRRKARKTV